MKYYLFILLLVVFIYACRDVLTNDVKKVTYINSERLNVTGYRIGKINTGRWIEMDSNGTILTELVYIDTNFSVIDTLKREFIVKHFSYDKQFLFSIKYIKSLPVTIYTSYDTIYFENNNETKINMYKETFKDGEKFLK